MTPAEFHQSLLALATPPAGLAAPLQALWWEAKGDWARAHAVAQEDSGRDGAWVHAYLHRVEGDESNAAYWYARATKPVAHGALAAERDAIVAALLAQG